MPGTKTPESALRAEGITPSMSGPSQPTSHETGVDPPRPDTDGELDPILLRASSYDRAEKLRRADLYPFCACIEAVDAREAIVRGRRCLNLGSNDYLGLSHDPRVVEAGARAAERYGAGSTGSRLLNGTGPLHLELERSLARFMGKPAGLVFPTGYQTNLGVVAGLVAHGDVAFVGRHDHASILDAGRLSMGRMVRFDSSDPARLESVIDTRGEGGRLVIVDGVHSMDGSIVDLPALVALRNRHHFVLAVDDAHAIGVLGASGAGTTEHFGLIDEVDLVIGTFSKAFGSNGGFVVGAPDVIDYLRHACRSFMFSAALSPFHAGATSMSLSILQSEPWRIARLRSSTELLRDRLGAAGFDTGRSQSPILPVLIGDEHRTLLFWKSLIETGIYGNPVIAPAVPDGECRIRLSLNAAFTDEDIERVVRAFDSIRDAIR